MLWNRNAHHQILGSKESNGWKSLMIWWLRTVEKSHSEWWLLGLPGTPRKHILTVGKWRPTGLLQCQLQEICAIFEVLKSIKNMFGAKWNKYHLEENKTAKLYPGNYQKSILLSQSLSSNTPATLSCCCPGTTRSPQATSCASWDTPCILGHPQHWPPEGDYCPYIVVIHRCYVQ